MGYSTVSPSKFVTESELNLSLGVEHGMSTASGHTKRAAKRVPIELTEHMPVERIG